MWSPGRNCSLRDVSESGLPDLDRQTCDKTFELSQVCGCNAASFSKVAEKVYQGEVLGARSVTHAAVQIQSSIYLSKTGAIQDQTHQS
jgi:hypothetical protein